MPENNQNQSNDHGDIIGYEARWDYEEQVPASSIEEEEEEEEEEGENG